MAFGYGMTGVGVTRVMWMLERTDGAEKRLGKIRDAARVSALRRWDALWDTSTRVQSLGTSFGTKLLHFYGYRQMPAQRPLILDKNVYPGLLDAGVEVPSLWERRNVYASYIGLAERWATQAGFDAACQFGGSDVIEFGLFQRGRRRERRRRLAARRLKLGLPSAASVRRLAACKSPGSGAVGLRDSPRMT
jgi:hypothetical protein